MDRSDFSQALKGGRTIARAEEVRIGGMMGGEFLEVDCRVSRSAEQAMEYHFPSPTAPC